MTQVNPNDAAASGCQDVQSAIARLDALKSQPGADIVAIDRAIDDLQAQDAALANQQLQAMIDSQQFGAALAAMNAAAATLQSEAANMQVTATDLTAAAKVVSAAASLVTALAPFLV